MILSYDLLSSLRVCRSPSPRSYFSNAETLLPSEYIIIEPVSPSRTILLFVFLLASLLLLDSICFVTVSATESLMLGVSAGTTVPIMLGKANDGGIVTAFATGDLVTGARLDLTGAGLGVLAES